MFANKVEKVNVSIQRGSPGSGSIENKRTELTTLEFQAVEAVEFEG